MCFFKRARIRKQCFLAPMPGGGRLGGAVSAHFSWKKNIQLASLSAEMSILHEAGYTKLAIPGMTSQK